MIFEESSGKKKVFDIGSLKGVVYVFLRTDDVNQLPQNGYRNYWFDNIDKVLTNILEAQQF
ncbi:MAG TPA: hypothetical protein EYP21_06205 [Syntrophaceae bacterium]|nr:hypothetical protein [Syntrophaceae bacterium]